MNLKQTIKAERAYFVLGGIFIACLVSGNLIFQKFFSWDFFNTYTFELSVGILPYPLTFLITDLISELYGRKRANYVVISGLIATLFIFILILLAETVPATVWSPVDDETFTQVFGLTGIAVSASMVAYLLAQFIDIRIYHFWKNKTKGKHLWLRNNFSTITSQFVDTAVVLLLLCYFETIAWSRFTDLLLNGFLFKLLIALLDTPVLYLLVYLFRKSFGLKLNQEIHYNSDEIVKVN